jgi:superfamily I DNA and/or RNA helicase
MELRNAFLLEVCDLIFKHLDPNQLPPTVLSSLGKEYAYEQSLFQRLMASIPKQIHLLSIQYRMHPTISSFPSRLFYESKLIDGPNLEAIREAEWHSLIPPYQFYNVAKGKETKKKGGKSVWNPEEVDACVALVYKLCVSFPHINVCAQTVLIILVCTSNWNNHTLQTAILKNQG